MTRLHIMKKRGFPLSTGGNSKMYELTLAVCRLTFLFIVVAPFAIMVGFTIRDICRRAKGKPPYYKGEF